MEAARTVIFVVIICMEAGYREDDRETWPTIGNLKKVLALFGLASPRRIEQLAGRLMQTGFLESRVSARDRDRKSVGEGKSVSVRVDLGGRTIIKKKKK